MFITKMLAGKWGVWKGMAKGGEATAEGQLPGWLGWLIFAGFAIYAIYLVFVQ